MGATFYTSVIAQASSLDAVAMLGMVLGISASTYAGVSVVRSERIDKVKAAIDGAVTHENHVDEHGTAEQKRKNRKHCRAVRRAKRFWNLCGWAPITLMVLISFIITIHYLAKSWQPGTTPTIELWPFYWWALATMTLVDLCALGYSFFASSRLLYAADSMSDLAETIKPRESKAGDHQTKPATITSVKPSPAE